MSYSHYQGKNWSVLWLSRQPPQHELALLCILEKKLNPFQNAEGKPKLMAVNINRPDLGLFIFNMGIFEEQKLFYGGKCRSCKKCKMDGVVFVIYLFSAMPTLISTWQYNWNILNSYQLESWHNSWSKQHSTWRVWDVIDWLVSKLSPSCHWTGQSWHQHSDEEWGQQKLGPLNFTEESVRTNIPS